ALATAGKEAEWLRNMIIEIPLWSKPIAPISILCDSVATIAKAYSQMYNGKSRHLEHGDGVTGIKQHCRDQSSDVIRKLTTASGRNRLISDLEDYIP
ncbi:hypothetical protein Tco_1529533, partial [Tanacetum coccineum]